MSVVSTFDETYLSTNFPTFDATVSSTVCPAFISTHRNPDDATVDTTQLYSYFPTYIATVDATFSIPFEPIFSTFLPTIRSANYCSN